MSKRKAISTASAKAKGRRLQQTVAKKLLDIWTHLEEDDVKSAPMGVSGEDVQLSPQARKSIPISVECKARKTIPIYSWYKQARDNTSHGREPVLVVKQDRKRPLAVVDLDHYLALLEHKEK